MSQAPDVTLYQYQSHLALSFQCTRHNSNQSIAVGANDLSCCRPHPLAPTDDFFRQKRSCQIQLPQTLSRWRIWRGLLSGYQRQNLGPGFLERLILTFYLIVDTFASSICPQRFGHAESIAFFSKPSPWLLTQAKYVQYLCLLVLLYNQSTETSSTMEKSNVRKEWSDKDVWKQKTGDEGLVDRPFTDEKCFKTWSWVYQRLARSAVGVANIAMAPAIWTIN